MRQQENYTPGYTSNASNFMAQRRAETHAAFLLPYLRPGMELLDCGCGPGTITLGLAQRVAPGHAVGIDAGESQIELARDIAAREGVYNAEFQVGSVYALPFENGTFDAVFSHAVMEHLSSPVKALQEIRRVLRPGGLAGICSPDWDGFLISPSLPGVKDAIDFYRRIQEYNGGNTSVGKQLGTLALEGGFARVKVSAYYECYESLERIADYLALRIEAAAEDEDVMKWTSAPRIAEFAQALRAWSTRPDGLFAQAWVNVVGWVD
jgi:ubiquinone/menaquinone biosynthesis C-methylase UbiE